MDYLFALDQDYDDALDSAVDLETGEVIDEKFFAVLDRITHEKTQKILDLAAFHKNLIRRANEIKAEKASMATRQKRKENKAAAIKRYINLHVKEDEVLEDGRSEIGWRKSEVVVIGCLPNELPEEFQKITIEAKKAEIKKEIKDGKQVMYCHIDKKNNMQIK